MKILITGANGFLGYYLTDLLLENDHEVIATGKGPCRHSFDHCSSFQYLPMDFTDPGSIRAVFENSRPDVIVHAGAISKPDDCEKDQWAAYQANVEGTISLLNEAEILKCFFIFLSTDFIFDGEKGMYREEDVPNPVNFYGKTKLEAEKAVKEYPFPWAIVRTVLVYGKPLSGRGNILSVVKEKLQKGEAYSVFNDQVRTPTYITDLAWAIKTIIEKQETGVFHISGEDVLTPYEMACHTARILGFDESLIKKVTAAEFVQPARRPAMTGFNIEKAKRQLGFKPISFASGAKLTFGLAADSPS